MTKLMVAFHIFANVPEKTKESLTIYVPFLKHLGDFSLLRSEKNG
jgi:hypothetical protein